MMNRSGFGIRDGHRVIQSEGGARPRLRPPQASSAPRWSGLRRPDPRGCRTRSGGRFPGCTGVVGRFATSRTECHTWSRRRGMGPLPLQAPPPRSHVGGPIESAEVQLVAQGWMRARREGPPPCGIAATSVWSADASCIRLTPREIKVVGRASTVGNGAENAIRCWSVLLAELVGVGHDGVRRGARVPGAGLPTRCVPTT